MSAAQESRPRVLVTGADLAPEAVALLTGYELVFAGRTPTEEQLVSLCRERQPAGIIVRYGRIPASVMDASPALRVISKHGAGIDTIDFAAAKSRGIEVKAAVGANAPAVAEHTWALILACAKSVAYLNDRVHAGHWDKATHKSMDLKGCTLGLVGLGAIGRRVARIGLAFDMRVIAHDPYSTQAPDDVELCGLEDLFRQSHVVSLHCPLTAENTNLIGPATLRQMRDGAILVNTARGGLVDEAAVAEALASGKLKAAGLDSFQNEPLTGPHAFSAIPNAILSPHVGGVTENAYVDMGVAAASNLRAVLEGVPPAAGA